MAADHLQAEDLEEDLVEDLEADQVEDQVDLEDHQFNKHKTLDLMPIILLFLVGLHWLGRLLGLELQQFWDEKTKRKINSEPILMHFENNIVKQEVIYIKICNF